MQNEKTQSRGLRRVLALMLCAALLLPLFWTGALASAPAVKHGMTTLNNVLFRKEPLDGADHYGYFSSGTVLEILGTATGSGKTWYKVKGEPITPKITYIGYVRSDVFRELTAQEEAALTGYVPGIVTPAPYAPVVTPSVNTTYTSGYVRVTAANTNLRTKPDGSSILQLAKNLILPCYGQEIYLGAYRWIYVLDIRTNQYGYIRSDCYRFVDSLGNPVSGPATPPPGAVTPVPGFNTPVPSGNYAIITVDAANLRQTPGGAAVALLPAGSVVSVTGNVVSNWYPVTYRGYTGYVSAEHLRMMTPAELSAYLGSGSVPSFNDDLPSASSLTGFVRIKAVRVNLRDRPDGASILQMDKGQIIPYYGAPQMRNGTGWLYVYYTPANVYGYVHQDFFEYVDKDGNPAKPATATPPPYATPAPSFSGYIKLIKSNVNLRATPGGNSLTQLAKGTVLPFEGSPLLQGGYSWVKVQETGTLRTGYIRSDCFEYVTSTGAPTSQPTLAPATPTPALPVPTVPGTTGGTVTLVRGGVNLRVQPDGAVLGRLDRGVTLPYYALTPANGYTWYYVSTALGYGYIRGDMVTVNAGSVSPSATPAPQGSYGYILTIKSNVNLRRTANGLTVAQVPKAKVYPIAGPTVTSGAYQWYYVQAEGNVGYLRGDCVRALTDAEIAAFLSNGTIPPVTPGSGGSTPGSTAPSGSIITTTDYVNLRVAPSLDAAALAQVRTGAVLPYTTTMVAGGYTWYQVSYNGTSVYALASMARIMTAAEYEAWKSGQPQATATVPPTPQEMSNIAVTVMSKVLLRREGRSSASVLTVLYTAGTRVTLTGGVTAAEGYTWYAVNAANVAGWIRGDMLRILSKSEAGEGQSTTPGSGGKPIVTYRTLRKGMSGNDVTTLQNALIALGLLPAGSANGVYTTQTETAVREYQKAANLFVDGVAGQRTQNALYNTAAPGDNLGSTGDSTIYPVEISDWNTGDIQTVWAKGMTATVTDVNSGLSFRARRWSGGYHVDAEPLTAADTSVMCRIYGVSRAQEISDKNLYQRRPLWVTVGGRTFAASMYGVPHNYPAGDTIPDNEFNGQFCVHFYNSRTHSSGRVDSDHMKAIQYAYDKAPQKK